MSIGRGCFAVPPGTISLISWNCRGLENHQSVRALQKVINKEDPAIVFLMETKSDLEWMRKVKEWCKFKHGHIVPSQGKSGGLAMFWREEVKLDIQTYSSSHIDAWVHGGDNVGWWHLTGFYGELYTSKRVESWQKMKHLCGTSDLPWLIIEDFNEITCVEEKEGGSCRPRQQVGNFVDTINWCRLKEVGVVGPRFTWLYQREDGIQIRERLDRALATLEWLSFFPSAKLFHLASSASDHSPLSLHFERRHPKRKMGRVFRFESMWLKDSRCEEVVHEAWDEGKLMGTEFTLKNCLDRCRVKLDAWNKLEFGHVSRMIAELQKKLKWLEKQPLSPELSTSLKTTRIELNCWLEKEDEIWRQRHHFGLTFW